MKNIFLTGLALMILGLATETFASPIDELQSKISQSSFSKTVKQNCLKALEEENKSVIKDCINDLKKASVNNLADKVKKLETKINALEKAGGNTNKLKDSLKKANNKLNLLESY